MPAIITTARPAPVAAAAVGMVPSPAPDLHRMDAPAATTGNNLPGTASLRPLDNPASFSAAYAWGDNTYGQLGNGTNTSSTTPVQVTGLTSGVTAVAGGSAHALAIQNGAVKAWGNNGNGQLGNSAYGSSTTPVQVMGLTSGVTAIAAGQEHSLAVQGGNVYAWGGNGDGQLGNGTTDSSATSLEIDPSDLKNITAVAAASNSSYALSSDGSLWVWGDNTDGELGLGDSAASDYLTPQHLLPPSGFAYTAIDASSNGNFADAILTQVPEPATWLGGTLLGMAALGGSLPRFRRPLAVSHGFRAAEMQF